MKLYIESDCIVNLKTYLMSKFNIFFRNDPIRNKIIRCFLIALIALFGFHCSSTNSKLQVIQNGILFKTSDLIVKIQFYDNNIVRVMKWLPGCKPDSSSLVIIQKNLPDLKITVQEASNEIKLTSAGLQVLVNKQDGHIQYFSNLKEPILKENGRPTIAPCEIKDEHAFSIKQKFILSADEGI